jgi:hypothetical protein
MPDARVGSRRGQGQQMRSELTMAKAGSGLTWRDVDQVAHKLVY